MARADLESVSRYLRQLGGHRQLTREEEYALARRAKRGDRRAVELLARHNLAFVVSVARKYMHRGARLDDLIQEGNVGLMKAIDHYDDAKNVRFATYAVWWIRAYITRYLKDNRSQVRGGEGERATMADLSLDVPVDEDAETTHVERLEDQGPMPDAQVIADRESEDVREALFRVKKRIGDLGWDIVQERLTQDQPRTLEELGERWGVSRERVRQVELKTRAFLSRYLESFNQDLELEQAPRAA